MAMLASAQIPGYAQSMIDTLCSPAFDGRGYVNDGASRAARFIANEMTQIGLDKLNSRYHHFTFNANTFPGDMSVVCDGNLLVPGRDFIVDPACMSVSFSDVKIIRLSTDNLLNKRLIKRYGKRKYKDCVLLIDTLPTGFSYQQQLEKLKTNFQGKLIIETRKKLTWSVARGNNKIPLIQILPGVITNEKNISVKIEAKMNFGIDGLNVLGYLKGSEVPDSFLVVTAHYDHLGRMGSQTYMPGANDNASGIAMMLDFAKYYSDHLPRYSILFIAFGAEEAGLIGSYFFVKEINNFLEPEKIRFLINMDLMGTGEEGIMAVNGKVFTSEFNTLDSINSAHNYLSVVKSRGKASNSDHYFFTEAGVPGFFFYLMGKYPHYHDVDDNRENLRLNSSVYSNAFLLIRDFSMELMRQKQD